jgi:hypothetical protein
MVLGFAAFAEGAMSEPRWSDEKKAKRAP